MSAGAQKEAFQTALSDALDADCNLEVVQAVHEQLREKLLEHKESKSPEPLEVTAQEVGRILQTCGVAQDQAAAFQDTCSREFGPNAVLNPANLIDSKRFQIKTPQVTISVDPESSHLVETRRINGRNYLLIPVEDGVEINGFPVGVESGGVPL